MIYNRTNRKSFLTRSRKKWLNYENGGKPQQEVLKKFYLFISLFVGLLRKLKKKQSIVAFLNKLNFFLFFFFFVWNSGKPLFCALYPGGLENPGIFLTQTLENSEKHPGKPLKLLEFELKFGWQPCIGNFNNESDNKKRWETWPIWW